MSTILHIDASPRAERSVSRNLAQEFVKAWKLVHPEYTYIYRDLGHNSVPHVDESWIAAAFTSPTDITPDLTEAIKISDQLIDELLAADRYIFSIPMYNFSIPSTFKAYIDQIVRAGRTFAVDSHGFKGLIEGKKMLVLTAQGGIYRPETPAYTYNFHEPYLRAIFGFLGITDIKFIYADGLNLGDEMRNKSISEAYATIQETANTW